MTRLPSIAILVCASVCLRCDDGTDGPVVFEHVVLGAESAPLTDLPPAFTAEETTALRAGFSWEETTPLPEVDEEGNPALYYAIVLVSSRDQLDTLNLSGISFDPFPLFEEEQGPWNRTGILEPVGDDFGTFVFALLPGAAYNLLRAEALAGRSSFGVVRLRDAPRAVRLRSGALRYEALAERGFTGTAAWADELYGGEESIGESAEPIVGRHEKLRWLRQIVRRLRQISDAIRRGVAAVRVGLGRTRTVRMRIRVLERDEAFLGHAADPTHDADLLTQAWQGPRRGTPVSVHGARVTFAANMWMVQRVVDTNGFVRAEVPIGKRLRIQLWLQSYAGQILTAGGLFDRRINIADDVVSEDTNAMNVTVRDRDAYVLGQVTDAWSYVNDVLGLTPRPAIVAMLPKNRPSFTPCLSYVRVELLVGALVASGAAVGSAAAALTFLAPPLGEIVAAALVGIAFAAPMAVPDWDILMQGDDAVSRLIPTHEYGHVHWCAQLREVSHAAVARGLIEGLKGLVAGADADVPQRTLTEAWADFLAAQVAGGVDYFELSSSSGRSVTSGLSTNFYCDADEQTCATTGGTCSVARPCLEDNWQGSTITRTGSYPGSPTARDAANMTMDVSVGTVTTLLVDAFDGPSSTMGTGTEWIFSSGIPRLTTTPFHFSPDDESVTLRPRSWLRVIEIWRDLSHDWTNGPVSRALDLAASESGETDLEICRLRNLHLDPLESIACGSFRPIVGGDGDGIVGLHAQSVLVDRPDNLCESDFHAAAFVAADGIESIRWRIVIDGVVISETTQALPDRRASLEPTVRLVDEARGPIQVQLDLVRGTEVVSTAAASVEGSPHCVVIE